MSVELNDRKKKVENKLYPKCPKCKEDKGIETTDKGVICRGCGEFFINHPIMDQSYRTYTIDKVKDIISTISEMIEITSNIWVVTMPGTRTRIENAITNAEKFPEELKNEKFFHRLEVMSEILKR